MSLSLQAQSRLVLSSGSGVPGAAASLALSLSNGSGARPAGLQWTLNYPISFISGVSVTAGPALIAAAKAVRCAGSPGTYTCLTTGLNANTIGDGVLVTVNFSLTPSAGSANIALNDVLGATAAAAAVPVSGTGATLTVAPLATNQPPVVNAGANQTITLPATATLNGSASDDNLPNGILTTTWNQLSGPGTATFSNMVSLSTTVAFPAAGAYVLQLAATDGALTSTSNVTITVNPPALSGTGIYINAGGASLKDAQNITWNGDNYYAGGATYTTATAISGAANSPLYQAVRYGTFSYNVPAPSGNYTVVLKFAEVYWTGRGQRVFNVAINGQAVLSNFDIVAQAGGAWTAVDKQFTATSTTGQINIQFTPVVDNAAVSAIAILPLGAPPAVAVTLAPVSVSLSVSQTQQFTAQVVNTLNTAVAWSLNPATGAGTVSSAGFYTAPSTIVTAQTVTLTATSLADPSKSASAAITLNPPPAPAFNPIRINAGGPAYIDAQGNTWSADTGYTGGAAYSSLVAIGGTATPALYQTCRYQSFTYSFSVPNGSHTVTLKFAEVYWTAPGQRVFNVLINGQPVLANFDIVAQAGGARLALDKQFPVYVTNGRLTIQAVPVVENPMINAIAIE